MSEHGIYFDHVWKKFRRGDQVTALRDLLRRRKAQDDLGRTEFWAVKDVSFTVRPGECLGIIGPNGAGKSTVLKLLTRILRPNRGSCELRGRVGSLIEISAGFHQDLTGRENVFLQGAIMGMKRREIRERFDDIVEFSGISQFIDMPVRRYSSGMNARLGFSIAAHLDPEVLIIDEVLSVGDFEFQQRAFGRIEEIVSRHVAAVVVSHQLERVSTLCERAVLLRQGCKVFEGDAADTIAAYVTDTGDSMLERDDAPLIIERLEVLRGDAVQPGDIVTLRLRGRVLAPERVEQTTGVSVRIRSLQSAQMVFGTSSTRLGVDLPGGEFTLEVSLEMNVEGGLYSIESGVFDRKQGKPIASGPRATVTVGRDFSFVGRAYARPTMRLVAGTELTAAAAVAGR
jgi:ABC-type polysaccharide/polyol phosphate transport system ATPase subunit